MSAKKGKLTTATAPTPRGIQYAALKGMSYRPSARDQHRRDRTAAKKALRRGEW